MEDLEMAAHFTSKSMSLMQVIKEQVASSSQLASEEEKFLEKDEKAFKGLTDQVT